MDRLSLNSQNFNIDYSIVTNEIEKMAIDVRRCRINWHSYYEAEMISHYEFKVMQEISVLPVHNRNRHLVENLDKCTSVMLALVSRMSKDQTIQYILTILDDLLKDLPYNVYVIFMEIMKSKFNSDFGPLLKLLTRSDKFITNQCSQIITKILLLFNPNLLNQEDIFYYFSYLIDALSNVTPFTGVSIRCLQSLLKIDEYCTVFHKKGGFAIISSILLNMKSYQLQYQLTFCLWLISFKQEYCSYIISLDVVNIMCQIVRESTKEKVARMIFATFRNIINNLNKDSELQQIVFSMIRNDFIKKIESLETKGIHDIEYKEDVTFMNDFICKEMENLSSFEEYASELESSQLYWSPPHKSKNFWTENVLRLHEQNYKLLKILVKLIEVSEDSTTVVIAIHDIGQYVSHFPRGKSIIDKLGGKTLIMQCLLSKDRSIRYQALVVLHKLMLHNWQHLASNIVQPVEN
ncbi:V-ATPase subunit H [Intoshia linei]|uniref:V-type proton ATPase subunit H n=1 Tax=Intoshia linei TaxID=1819745 RepID=A0A177B1L8_9BILA|nr:V-ATPase subunit H [Intoshia linei]